ncbi:pRiA4b ORF-3-like protein [Lentibacillus persicus]|uniref:PRiA4b ORF-3-like protein n=1 Tax=Lentibacillus persicus TaxID=640948 RepID=A0A1I1Y0Z8_9BACI|nr:hypothetical protein [Lentibacillus persicus]SFE12688.1 pRiA4b ORF-3-like protein [Lentibacillus persicus]
MKARKGSVPHCGVRPPLVGAETAPPEDVGGIPGFYTFMEIYHNKNHPEHDHMKEWAEEQLFREFDPEFINDRLKSIKYKKTELDKINKQE